MPLSGGIALHTAHGEGQRVEGLLAALPLQLDGTLQDSLVGSAQTALLHGNQPLGLVGQQPGTHGVAAKHIGAERLGGQLRHETLAVYVKAQRSGGVAVVAGHHHHGTLRRAGGQHLATLVHGEYL